MKEQEHYFDFSAFSNEKCDKKWLKTVRNKRGRKYKLFLLVLNDAKEGKEVLTKGGSYYSCARFIKRYHKTFTFKKGRYEIITCCNAYPKECGGVCCFQKRLEQECGCDTLPRSVKHLRNCYDDCCNIFRYTSKRRFYLQWQKR